ncbi:hypothetical protein [Bacillus cereus]|uniref:hypothetical protein n=1 Tax=Bacillus cereus TaxID=1396 RepID=UPI001419D096|nr:hypothetical protein [Bacillus cereus]
MIDYYQMFLITMADIALFFYIQHAGKPTKRNKWKFLIAVFLSFKNIKKEGVILPFIIQYVHANI